MSLLQIHEPGETPTPHSDEAAVGIDLGTTHSVIAVSRGEQVEVLHDICGGVLIPSAVYYAPDGEVSVGKKAAGYDDTLRSVKRLMGRAASDVQSASGTWYSAPLEETAHGLAIQTQQGNKTPVEVSAEILKHLKKQAEAALSKEVSKAVITVPAYFDDAARTATRDAARLAGLEVLRLINEPTAAALAYGLDHAVEGIYAIYDLGGGTFDISLLKLEKGVFQVLSTAGDIALGGDDFDMALATHLAQYQHEGSTGKGLEIDGKKLLEARALKERLSDESSVKVHVDVGSDVTVTNEQFEAMIAALLQRTVTICEQAVADAGVEKSEIHGVVLVGGSTRIPAVRRTVEGYFAKTPLTNVDPDQVVAVGAAIQAEGLTQGSDNLLLDVTPLSLGLETMGDLVEKVIHRNTPIPTAVSQEFTTYQDGQTALLVHILQGEREMVGQCRSLAKFTLNGIPPLPAGIARIKVTFMVDADGLLSVAAREETTGVEQSIEVKPAYGLSPEAIEQMLRESMENAKEDITMRLLAEARFESNRLIEELKSAMSHGSGMLSEAEMADNMAQIIVLQRVIEGTDRDAIDYQRSKLEKMSDGFAQRRMDTAIRDALQGTHIEAVE